MTIAEIEERSGLLRANIRYYETEGFISPERSGNGYRNYSEEDLAVLEKIKLLRSLQVPLHRIKDLHRGDRLLSAVMEEHINKLKEEQLELKKSQRVCEVIRRENAEYATLDTAHYINLLTSWSQETGIREDWKREDREKVRAPFRRLLARLFDYMIYMILWLLTVAVFHRLGSFSETTLVMLVFIGLSGIGPWLLALLFETFLLHWFGTTPGKWLLGLSVMYDLGGRIPKDMAWKRTRHAVFAINEEFPIRHQEWYQTKQIYEQAEQGDPLLWDYLANTSLVLKDRARWRSIVYAILMVLFFAVVILICHWTGVFSGWYTPEPDWNELLDHFYVQ
ncbi:MAG: MerR family transcriptional regulator [Lachnospiraceae bacterium]|nr:MerR family transcriptional regulator [Lachnospiraceae bacterium]